MCRSVQEKLGPTQYNYLLYINNFTPETLNCVPERSVHFLMLSRGPFSERLRGLSTFSSHYLLSTTIRLNS